MEKILIRRSGTALRAVYVCPVRRLYRRLDAGKLSPKTAAVLCTVQELDAEKLSCIRYLHARFADTEQKEHPEVLTERLAARIVDFIEGCSEAEELYFCCDSGESRSSAVCAAVLRAWHGDEQRIWRAPQLHPNCLVYRRMCAALGCRTSRMRTYLLRQRNRREFRKACARKSYGPP